MKELLSDNNVLRIHQTIKNITTLGPYTRYGIWVQGCNRNCPGCISQLSQSAEGGFSCDIDVLAQEILQTDNIEGITISGGEPFLQKEALCGLIEKVKAEKDLGIILYTGYFFDEIASEKLTALCDSIIDGPYIEEKNDNRSLRGSSNQSLIHISQRYRDKFFIGRLGREFELCSNSKGGLSIVGVIPKEKQDLGEKLRKLFNMSDSL